MNQPTRIQRKRVKGWRAPEGAVYVGRGTEYGNPITIGSGVAIWDDGHIISGCLSLSSTAKGVRREIACDAAKAVELYRLWLLCRPELISRIIPRLRGKTLMCWCAPEMPCHADVLLEFANKDEVNY